jgi:hypothetical protein
MGVLDIFKRKKKDEDFLELGADVGRGGYGPGAQAQPQSIPAEQPPAGFGDFPGMPAQPMPVGAEGEIIKKDVETLNYKMDSLKATLDQINARLTNIEQALKGKQGWQY